MDTDVDIILEAYQQINNLLLLEDLNEDAIKWASEYAQFEDYFTKEHLEQRYGPIAKKFGFPSAKALFDMYKLYKQIYVDNDKSILNLSKKDDKPKPYEGEYDDSDHDRQHREAKLFYNTRDLVEKDILTYNKYEIHNIMNLMWQNKLHFNLYERGYDGKIKLLIKDVMLDMTNRKLGGGYDIIMFVPIAGGLKRRVTIGDVYSSEVLYIESDEWKPDINLCTKHPITDDL